MKKITIGMISFLGGCILSTYNVAKICEKAMKVEERQTDKYNINLKIACKWIRGYQTNRKIKEYLDKKGIHEVAVYGMGELGKCLLEELDNEHITVKYVIDRNNYYKAFGEHLCYLPSKELPEVQAIIVTPVSEFENIAEQLRRKTSACLIPLNEVIDELYS